MVESQLSEVEAQLAEARADRRETNRERRMAEAVDAMRRLFPGVHGRLTELGQVTQRIYQLALAVAMGKDVDSVVVDNERTAMECIQYLKEQKLMPMTFIPLATCKVRCTLNYRSVARLHVGSLELLGHGQARRVANGQRQGLPPHSSPPLDHAESLQAFITLDYPISIQLSRAASPCQVKPINERLRTLGGSAKLAIDLIQFDVAFERAFTFVFENTLVCDTADEARQLAYNAGERHKVPRCPAAFLPYWSLAVFIHPRRPGFSLMEGWQRIATHLSFETYATSDTQIHRHVPLATPLPQRLIT
eukprot:362070-Chlamydomonas_euryale.AAC.25